MGELYVPTVGIVNNQLTDFLDVVFRAIPAFKPFFTGAARALPEPNAALEPHSSVFFQALGVFLGASLEVSKKPRSHLYRSEPFRAPIIDRDPGGAASYRSQILSA
jgi:hypothetical protein